MIPDDDDREAFTLCCRSYRNFAGTYIIDLVVHVQVFAFESMNVTADSETGEYLADKTTEVLKKLEDHNVKVFAIVSDSASNCKSARRKIVETRPDIFTMDCAAHQMSLLTHDFFKVIDFYAGFLFLCCHILLNALMFVSDCEGVRERCGHCFSDHQLVSHPLGSVRDAEEEGGILVG